MLGQDQKIAIQHAAQWEKEALIELALARDGHRVASHALATAAERVAECERRLQHATGQCDNVVRLIAGQLELGDGELVYDVELGSFTKKDNSDAQQA